MHERTRLGANFSSSLRRHAVAWSVLLVSLIATGGLWWGARQHARDADQERARRYVNEMQVKIEERLRSHEQVLAGASALFDADATVRNERWKKYSARVDLPARAPGVLGLGFVEVISRRQKDELITRMRAQKLRDFDIYPPGKREVYTPVLMLEPGEGANRRAPGFDMWTQPALQAALARAGDTRAAALSAPVTLNQEKNPNPMLGAMLFLPVYWESDIGPSVWRPLGRVRGWVYSPIFAQDFLRSLENPGVASRRLEIRDASDGQGDTVPFASHEPNSDAGSSESADASASLQVFGRTWWVSARLSRDSAPWTRANVMGVAALMASFFLFAIVLRLSRTKHRMIGSAQELKRQLQVKTDELRAVHDHAPVAVVEISSDSKTVRLNKRCEDLVELTESQAQDWGWSRRIHPDDRQAVALAFQTALTRGAEFESKHRIHKENVWVKWVCVKMVPIWEHERLSRFIGVVEDISSMKEIAQALEEGQAQTLRADAARKDAEERLMAIMEALNDAVVLTNDQGSIQSVNTATCRMFGLDQKDLLGQRLSALMPEKSRELWDLGFRDTSAPLPKLEGFRSDGQEFPLEIAVSEVIFGGERVFLCVMRDITGAAAAEEELKKYQARLRELEENTRAVPVPQVTITSQARPDFLAGKINEVGQRLLSSLDELLELSKLRVGVIQFGIHEMNALVRGWADELGALSRRQGASIAVEGSNFPVYAWCDPQRIAQVMRILLSNAVKFTPVGKRILVRIAQSWLPEGRRAEDMGIVEAAEVSVIDEGTGIPEGELEKVFEKSARSSTIQSVSSGAGLSLAICREILHQHEGHINASHNPAGGAVFTFVLPCRQRRALSITEIAPVDAERVRSLET